TGTYTFSDLPAGTYDVGVANNGSGANRTVGAAVSGGGSATRADLGITPNADLTGTAFSVDSNAGTSAGDSILVHFTITNRGNGDAGPSSAEIRLSADGSIDDGDPLMATVAVPGLRAGESFTG